MTYFSIMEQLNEDLFTTFLINLDQMKGLIEHKDPAFEFAKLVQPLIETIHEDIYELYLKTYEELDQMEEDNELGNQDPEETIAIDLMDEANKPDKLTIEGYFLKNEQNNVATLKKETESEEEEQNWKKEEKAPRSP